MGTAASYPRPITRVSLSLHWSPRVYYRSFVVVLSLLVVAALGASRTDGQVELTVHPSMVKGPAGAPVTIVEFSDYQ